MYFMLRPSTIIEPRHDKTNKMTVRPAKTQISLGIRPVWSESSLSAWSKLGSFATHWANSEDSDQTVQMSRLIRVFAGRTLILLVLWCRCSIIPFFENNKLPLLWSPRLSRTQLILCGMHHLIFCGFSYLQNTSTYCPFPDELVPIIQTVSSKEYIINIWSLFKHVSRGLRTSQDIVEYCVS